MVTHTAGRELGMRWRVLCGLGWTLADPRSHLLLDIVSDVYANGVFQPCPLLSFAKGRRGAGEMVSSSTSRYVPCS